MAIIDLTTLARVQAALDIPSTDTAQDARLSLLITAVSRRIEQWLNRGVEVAARTDLFDVLEDQYRYQLTAYPVTTLTSVKVATDYDFASATAKTVGTDFTIDTTAGIVEQLTSWSGGSRVLQIVHTSGLAANTAAVLSDHPDLAYAAEAQIVEEWTRRGSMLRSSSNVSGSTETSVAVPHLLPIVREIVQPYRRPVR